MNAMRPSSNSQHSSGFINTLEETIIAVLLGLMTLITFTNVVLRYGFNSSLIWGLEIVLVLFAWLILFGIAYGFKITSHLGVDAVTTLLPYKWQRIVLIAATFCCILYSVLLLKGAWDYWAPFAALDRTSGRWFPTGFEKTRDQAFYITDQIPMPDFLRFLESLINQGETYDKLPRVVPYTMLPVAALLILFRVLQASVRIFKGNQHSLIVSHEAEEAVEEAQQTLRES
ncbi:MAG: TRAP transporter small permease [Granulosicoccus sp.]|nr:TRAP transporter small permease [Granulosicoccus sp.]